MISRAAQKWSDVQDQTNARASASPIPPAAKQPIAATARSSRHSLVDPPVISEIMWELNVARSMNPTKAPEVRATRASSDDAVRKTTCAAMTANEGPIPFVINSP